MAKKFDILKAELDSLKNEMTKKEIELEMAEEKISCIFNALTLFFSAIPFFINTFNKFWEITEKGELKTIVVSINMLGTFAVGSYVVTTIKDIFKATPLKDNNLFVKISNIVFLIIYCIYLTVVPVCFFIGYEKNWVTYFSVGALGVRIIQSFFALMVNVGKISKFAKQLGK